MAENDNHEISPQVVPNIFIVGQTEEMYTSLYNGESGKNIMGIRVNVTTPYDAMSMIEADFRNVSAASLDAIFSPYTTETGHLKLPYWTSPEDGAASPTSRDLNPFFPSVTSTGNPEAYYASGSNIGAFNSFSGIGSGADGDLNPYVQIHDSNTVGSFARSVGFKAPIVLTGWGYDTEGNPVPADSEDSSKFASGAFTNPNAWKSGPVDLRWDNARGVWTGGNTTKIYLVKTTNLYTPPSFSFEVDRSTSRDQFTRNAPATMQSYADYGGSAESGVLLDPEYVAFTGNNQNAVGNTYEQLDYTGLEFPFYEAFIIRETVDSVGQTFYNIWTEDCQDCGHVANPCTSGSFPMHGSSGNLIVNKKILIENPLRQALDVGDLAFTVDTGRRKRVNTGSFVGGSGENATAYVEVNSSGSGQVVIGNAGSGYIYGGFGILTSGLCASVALTFAAPNSGLSSGTITPDTNLPSGTYPITVYPANATAATENLPIHWIMQAEFKSQQVITHVECEHGMLQTCSLKIQTQGYKSCEWCGEDSALVNSF